MRCLTTTCNLEASFSKETSSNNCPILILAIPKDPKRVSSINRRVFYLSSSLPLEIRINFTRNSEESIPSPIIFRAKRKDSPRLSLICWKESEMSKPDSTRVKSGRRRPKLFSRRKKIFLRKTGSKGLEELLNRYRKNINAKWLSAKDSMVLRVPSSST